MNTLQQMFPALTLFSDLNWNEVTREYEQDYMDVSFPEYLQQKAIEGDCPPYLYELAYYELAAFNAKTSSEPFPFKPGIYLNPTALFLGLEFDIPRMLEEANEGRIEIYERPHVLCLYRDTNDEVNSIELDKASLEILQQLENGPLSNKNFLDENNSEAYEYLVEKNLIFELI